MNQTNDRTSRDVTGGIYFITGGRLRLPDLCAGQQAAGTAFDPSRKQLSDAPLPIVGGVSFDEHVGSPTFRCLRMEFFSGTGHSALVQPTFVGRDGTHIRAVGKPDFWFSPRLAPNDLWLALARTNPAIGHSTLWTVDLRRDVISNLVTKGSRNGNPVWSPDGRSIVFLSARGGPFELFTKNVTEPAEEVQMLSPGPSRFPTDYSRDGKHILYSESKPQSGFDLWLLTLDESDRRAFAGHARR
ncbi:MAG: hypothetical protein WKF37_00255 [Bryobacteraceae bacterium]